MSVVADFAEADENGRRILRFTGSLVLGQARKLGQKLDTVQEQGFGVDLSAVGRMDTVGAWLIHKFIRDRGAQLVAASEEHRTLLQHVAKADQPVTVKRQAPIGYTRVAGEVGEAAQIALGTLKGLVGFFGAFCIALWTVIVRPRRLRVNAVVQRFEVVGIHALGIVGLMSFLVGIVIAQQGAVQLRQFGAEVFTVNLIGRSAMKELGVLMTAIMVAGRSGSAFAAQIGSMRLNEEVDAMRTIGVSPMEALVLPRVLATVLMMPLLGFYAAVLAMLGGGLFCWLALDIPPVTFIQRIREIVPITDVWQTLIKAVVFGLIISLAGCFQGMQVEGNSEEVGLRTTAAVVQGIFLVIVLDAFFAVFFTAIGWP